MKKELNILIAITSVWCGLIVLTPVIASMEHGDGSISNVFYRLFGAVCHQFDSRSFHLYEHSFAVCVRCSAIYFGFLLALGAVRISPQLQTKTFSLTPLLVVTCVPMLIDGICSLFNIYQTTTYLRMITGSFFGIGIALLLHKSLSEIIQSTFTIKKRHYETETR